MIKKTAAGYKVVSKSSGKSLSKTYKTKAAAVHRMRQIEWFKNQKK